MGGMDRRLFLLAGSALLAAPLARAQKTYRIGWLSSGVRPARANVSYDAFMQRMGELGYVEGRTLLMEQRYGDASAELVAQRAAELVRLRVDLILATTTLATSAASKATSTIPIVMGSAANPLAAGLVSNLSRPGGNITGMTLDTADTTAKRLELLKTAIPAVRRVAALHPAEIRGFASVADWLRETESAAARLGVAFVPVDLPQRERHRWEEILGKVAADGIGAATVFETPTYLANRDTLAELCLKHRIAAVFPFREQAEAGGLMAYGADIADLYRQAAETADKILKGAKPGDIPVQQPTRFNLVVNLNTAKALGLAIPPAVLLRATSVIP